MNFLRKSLTCDPNPRYGDIELLPSFNNAAMYIPRDLNRGVVFICD
jgi:hypothetical protein